MQVRGVDQTPYHHELTVSSLGSDCQSCTAPLLKVVEKLKPQNLEKLRGGTGFTSIEMLHTHTPFYTQTLLQTNAFTHRRFFTETPLRKDSFTHYFVLQSSHKVRPSTTSYYKARSKVRPSTSSHHVRPSTTSYYKARTKYVPILFRITKLAQSTSQYYFVLQSFHKVRQKSQFYLSF